ncbi:MBL fold metallo-hydrolase [Aquimarina sp. 2304DJ70-9]|uniref:MBL fold metallo-hydrolase n=1 Tax=Aquimarina penaris TaxID=3231044 RepID=UPI00346186E7
MDEIKLNPGRFRWVYIFLIVVTIQSCTMVKVSVSDKRNPVPQTIEFNENLKITTWGAIKVNKSDFFPSSFQIVSGGKTIYIDPVETGISRKADYIFITHAHPDHYSLKTIEQIVSPETIFICPKEVMKKLSKKGYTIRTVIPDDNIKMGSINTEAVHAYNTKNVFLWIKAHPKSKKNVGYILTLGGDIRIYHAGDTDYIPEMEKIKDITIAMVPIGGDNLTMSINEASKIINKIRPKLVIPMHYELKNKADLIKFKSLVDKDITVTLLE